MEARVAQRLSVHHVLALLHHAAAGVVELRRFAVRVGDSNGGGAAVTKRRRFVFHRSFSDSVIGNQRFRLSQNRGKLQERTSDLVFNRIYMMEKEN